MARTIWSHDQVAQLNYRWWQMAFFGRSAVLVILWISVDYIIRTNPQVLTGIYTSLKVDNHTIRAFGTNILCSKDRSGVAGGRILSSYTWVALSSVVLAEMYIWNRLVVRTTSQDIGTVSGWNNVVHSCLVGETCYSMNNADDLFGLRERPFSGLQLFQRALWWDLTPACDAYLSAKDALDVYEQMRTRSRRFRMILCHKAWPATSLSEVIGSLCVGAAILMSQRALFEVVTIMMLRRGKHRLPTVNLVVYVVGMTLLLTFVYLSLRDTLWGISAASNDSTALLAIVTILWQAKRVSDVVRTLRNYEKETRIRQLHGTSLGLEIDRAFNFGKSMSSEKTVPGSTRSRATTLLHKLLKGSNQAEGEI